MQSLAAMMQRTLVLYRRVFGCYFQFYSVSHIIYVYKEITNIRKSPRICYVH